MFMEYPMTVRQIKDHTIHGNDKISADERFDICNKNLLNEFIYKTEPDFIFHLAAQALVSKSYDQPFETILTNAIGTLNLLEIIKNFKEKSQ